MEKKCVFVAKKTPPPTNMSNRCSNQVYFKHLPMVAHIYEVRTGSFFCFLKRKQLVFKKNHSFQVFFFGNDGEEKGESQWVTLGCHGINKVQRNQEQLAKQDSRILS